MLRKISQRDEDTLVKYCFRICMASVVLLSRSGADLVLTILSPRLHLFGEVNDIRDEAAELFKPQQSVDKN